MFSLRNSSSGSSSGSDEDSFGWWIGVEIQSQATESPSCSSGTSDDVSESRALARDLASDTQQQQQPTNHDAEDIQMRLLNVSGKPEDVHGRALCYTPERLIRSEDYRIVTPSPRFCPGLSTPRNLSPSFQDGDSGWTPKTMDKKMIGAEHLAALLRSSHRLSTSSTSSCRRCCCIWYGDGEVLLHTERCPKTDEETDGLNEPIDFHLRLPSECESYCDDNNPLSDDGCSRERDQLSVVTDDVSRLSTIQKVAGLPPDLQSHANNVHEQKLKDGQQQQRRLSGELTRLTREAVFDVCEKQNDAVSIVARLNNESNNHTKTLLLNNDRLLDTCRKPRRDCLTKLVLTIQPNDKLTPIRCTDPEVELELLRSKLEKIQGSNKDLYEEITLLWRDFTKDEWRVNHLSEDVNKLRNEVYELRYMDDLLKLLKGELERISNRNWPFAIGHVQHETEEINLVV